MAQPTVITSPLHFTTVIKSSTYVLTDWHATWCGPCHAIAPVYASLAKQHSSPNLTFTKIDVDAQQQLAREYGITAMPTFLLFKDGKVVETVRGANPPALKAIVEKASREVKAAEEEKRKAEEERKKQAETVEEGNDVSVGGNYGITKGSGWKMSLR
jgi:thioredoxin 1